MAPATVRRAPYKDFLQPALQRRFSTTATILLVLAYAESILLANWNSYFWSWFPISITGIRAGFLFSCGLIVIILRIAQYHVGICTSNSGFETFTKYAFKLRTVETAFSYVLSSWVFSQVYLWSARDSANLGWITYHTADRARLNERAVFLTVFFIVLGLAQAFMHLFYDYDRLTLGTVQRQRGEGVSPGADSSNQIKKFLSLLPSLIIDAGNYSLVSTFFTALLYVPVFRSSAWQIALSFFRPFYNLPKTNFLPPTYPFVSIWILLRCFTAGFMLWFVWATANKAFTIFLAKEPLKNGKPLSSDSKDPNGSLLNGLKSKKLPIRCFAMWELAHIARDFGDRRKTIYEDIDRKDGPAWSQVCALCLDIVKSLETKIDQYGKKPAPAQAAPAPETKEEKKPRVSAPPKEDAIFVSTPPKRSFRDEVEKAVSKAATQPGQESRLSPAAKKVIAEAKEKLQAIQQEATGVDNPNSLFQTMLRKALEYPFIGYPMREPFGRRLITAVLASPYGEPSLYVNAANALSLLSVHSLAEDKFGNVQRDIPGIIRTFTSVTRKLDAFRAAFPMHWTDVRRERECPEVDKILDALRDGLGELITAFGPYGRELRLSMTDMRLAREAVAVSSAVQEPDKQPDMREIG